jgi:hypothetical protein
VAADGLNITLDIKTWTDIQTVLADLKAVKTEVEAAYAGINADVS